MSDRTLPLWLRLILLGTAATQIVFGLTLLFNPSAVSTLWPWTLTPVTARLLGASSLVSIPLSVLSAIGNRYSSARIPLIMSLIYRIFQIVAGLIGLSRFDFSQPITWNYFGGGTVMLFVFAYAWLRGPHLGRPVESLARWQSGGLSLGRGVRMAMRLIALVYFSLGLAMLVLGPGADVLWFEAAGKLTPLTARLFSGTLIGLSVGLWLVTRARAWSEAVVPAAAFLTIGVASSVALLLDWGSVAPSTPLGYVPASAPLVLALIGVYLLLFGRRASQE
ncbi:MAG: hypothetical protein PVH65_11415 [Chloroflexota bacterium]|jgi:hypothetical protein